MPLSRTSEPQQSLILNRSFYTLSLSHAGLLTKLLFLIWHDHTCLSVTNSLHMMGSSSNKTMSSSPLLSATSCYTSSTQLTVILSSHSAMLVTVCSGLASPVRSRTCVKPVSPVLNTLTKTLVNHSSLIQYPLYPGNWSLRTCLNSKA